MALCGGKLSRLDGHVRESGLNSAVLLSLYLRNWKHELWCCVSPIWHILQILLEGKGCNRLLYLYDLIHITHTKKLMILDYESQNNKVSLRVGLAFSKVYWGFESLENNKKNLAIFFSKKHKIFNWIYTSKKRKTHLEMTYFILMKG